MSTLKTKPYPKCVSSQLKGEFTIISQSSTITIIIKFLPDMVGLGDFVEPCRDRCYDDKGEDYRVPLSIVTRTLLKSCFN